MRREDLVDLNAFVAVAEERSFTRAASRLGTSQSALSYTIRRLETRLGVRLLTRTTRSVSPTPAGERLLQTLLPALGAIDHELARLTELREVLSGTVRINAGEHAIETVLWPVLDEFSRDFPEIRVEATSDQGMIDIVSGRYDAGIRLGERVAKDMIAVRVGPDARMAAVATPGYFEDRPVPDVPEDLARHRCINLRMPTSGGLYAWEFEKNGRSVNMRVDGQFTFNSVSHVVNAVLRGFGLGFVLEDRVREPLDDGRLVRVLEDWCPPFPGYHLYYPSRRQLTPAFALLVEKLRSRAGTGRGP